MGQVTRPSSGGSSHLMKTVKSITPASVLLAERLIQHEARRCARLYRPLLGHEQEALTVSLAQALDNPSAQKILQQRTPRSRARLLVRNARFATLTLLKSLNS